MIGQVHHLVDLLSEQGDDRYVDPVRLPLVPVVEARAKRMCYATLKGKEGFVPPRTGAERYFDHRMKDPDYAEAYDLARARIDAVDDVIRALDERRTAFGLSKADLARRAGLQPEAVRRLFSSGTHNPTLSTISALVAALDAELRLVEPRVPTASPGDAVQKDTQTVDPRTT
jgi:DNA-binding phage protein